MYSNDDILALPKKSLSDRNREKESEREIEIEEWQHRFGISPKERTLISRDTERICICKPERRRASGIR